MRLASEAIQGALAMKMLSWQRPIAAELSKIRSAEAACVRQMARIRAVNNALNWWVPEVEAMTSEAGLWRMLMSLPISCYRCVTPVVAFATFTVYRALNGTLDIPKVFYALSLLALPKLYM